MAHDKRDQIIKIENYPEEKIGQDETAQCNNSLGHSVQNEFDMGLLLYEEKNQEATANQGTSKSPDEFGQNRSDHNESNKELDKTNKTKEVNLNESDLGSKSQDELDQEKADHDKTDQGKNFQDKPSWLRNLKYMKIDLELLEQDIKMST